MAAGGGRGAKANRRRIQRQEMDNIKRVKQMIADEIHNSCF
jgi:hypothetical protein